MSSIKDFLAQAEIIEALAGFGLSLRVSVANFAADVLERVCTKAELESAGCSIPYPRTDAHLHPAD